MCPENLLQTSFSFALKGRFFPWLSSSYCIGGNQKRIDVARRTQRLPFTRRLLWLKQLYRTCRLYNPFLAQQTVPLVWRAIVLWLAQQTIPYNCAIAIGKQTATSAIRLTVPSTVPWMRP